MSDPTGILWDEMNGLMPCPLCGGHAVWCGDQPGEEHSCHHILCAQCKAAFDLARAADPDSALETIGELRDACGKAYNRRHIDDPKTAFTKYVEAEIVHGRQADDVVGLLGAFVDNVPFEACPVCRGAGTEVRIDVPIGGSPIHHVVYCSKCNGAGVANKP